jgi:hypothetical protein
MNGEATLIICLSSLLVAGCMSSNPGPAGKEVRETTCKDAGHVARIGVYDSRAVALAFIKSELYSQMVADCEGGQLATLQQGFYAQVLSTAPVDGILVYIEDQLSGITEQAGADLILSKWDSESLAMHAHAEQVDITMQLVAAFNPSDELIREAIATQKLAPVSLEQAERMRQL